MAKTKNAEAISFPPSQVALLHLAKQPPKKMLFPFKKTSTTPFLTLQTQPWAQSSRTQRQQPEYKHKTLCRHNFPRSLDQTTKNNFLFSKHCSHHLTKKKRSQVLPLLQEQSCGQEQGRQQNEPGGVWAPPGSPSWAQSGLIEASPVPGGSQGISTSCAVPQRAAPNHPPHPKQKSYSPVSSFPAAHQQPGRFLAMKWFKYQVVQSNLLHPGISPLLLSQKIQQFLLFFP